MLNLPPQFILFDTEYTAWEGSQARKWTGPNEYREMVQIGAIKVNNDRLAETDSWLRFVKPKLNPTLSKYFMDLTNIKQEEVDKEGIELADAVSEFSEWCGDLPIYSFGFDGKVLTENCELVGIEFPFPMMQFNDMRDFFKLHGIRAENYYSSTIVEAFGGKPSRIGHDALNDARTILDGLTMLEEKLSKQNNNV